MTGTQVLSADQIAESAFQFRHPLDPAAGCSLAPMSRLAGLKSGAINLVRVAPGAQAFPLHRHHAQEEWLYVLDGRGEILSEDAVQPVASGDFAVFAAAGAAHAVRNTGPDELTCLMGGDAPAADIVDFPGLGKRVVKDASGYYAAPVEAFVSIQPKPEDPA